MSEKIICDREDLVAIADATRTATGNTGTYSVSELRDAAVAAIGSGGGLQGAVLYVAQTLTDDQKFQARLNIDAVPTSRTVNGKPMSTNITLSASDVGADSQGSAAKALADAKSYVDTKIGETASPDWNQNDETAPDYIKNRTHWAEDPVTVTEVTMEETTFDGFDEFGTYQAFGAYNFVNGAECVVTWDGVEYTCIAEEINLEGGTYITMGNPAILDIEENAEDNGQPFGIVYVHEYGMMILLSNNIEATSHSMKITSTITTQEIHKLDDKYIDAEWMAKSPIGYESVPVVDEVTVNANDDGGIAIATIECDISAIESSDKIYVTLDGIEYVSTAQTLYDEMIICGNLSMLMDGQYVAGDPYVALFMEGGILLYLATAGEHTISVRVEKPVYEQLPTGYIRNVLNTKQNKLTGVAGQVVGFDSNGNAIAQEAPSSGSSVEVDTTLSVEGAAADAAIVGSKFNELNDNMLMTNAAATFAQDGALTWNGVIGDREYVTLYEESGIMMCYVHISDEVPSQYVLDIASEIPALVSFGFFEEAPLQEVFPTSLIQEMDGIYFAEGIVIITNDNTTIPDIGLSFPKAGVYAMSYSYLHSGIDISLQWGAGLWLAGHSFSSSGGSSDKYFEKVEKTTDENLGDTLTWDGNTSGLANIGGLYCVFSGNTLPTIDDLADGFECRFSDGQGGKYPNSAVNVVEDGAVLRVDDVFTVVHPNYSGVPLGMPAGIYFKVSEGRYLTSLTISGYNFINSVTETREVIKYEHLPEALQFGEITTTTKSGTLTWDGDREGKTLIPLNGDIGWYKVSNAVPTLEDVYRGFTLTEIKDGELEQTIVSADETQNNQLAVNIDNNNNIISLNALSVTIVQSTTTLNGTTYPAGIYFFDNCTTVRTASLTINGYEFETTTTVVKTIDPKYLPEALRFGEEIEYESIIDLGEMAIWDGEVGDKICAYGTDRCIVLVANMSLSIEELTAVAYGNGMQFTISTSNSNYDWIPINSYSEDVYHTGGVDGGQGNIYFVYADNAVIFDSLTFPKKGIYFENSNGTYATSLTIPNHNFTIQKTIKEVVKIDPKYLPEGMGGGGIAEETDPTVPAWAKEATKPTYTASEVGAAEKTHTHTASEVGADVAGAATSALNQAKAYADSILPTVAAKDAGKFLRVSASGKWIAEAIPRAEEASF